MRHPTSENWIAYIENRMPVPERERIEQHLTECGHCLEVYIQAMAGLAGPELPETWQQQFAGRVMEEIADLPVPKMRKEQTAQRRKPRPAGERRQKMLHYAIAVCFMLVLMSTGVFEQLAHFSGQWRPEPFKLEQMNQETEDSRKLTDTLMRKTRSVIASMLERNEEIPKTNGVKAYD